MEDFYNMADLGKHGHEGTGYTEPFIVPPGVTVAAAQISTQNLGVVGIVGVVPVEYSTNRNSGLFVTALTANGGAVTFTSKSLNFDTRMEFNKSRFAITVGATTVTVDGISYDNVTEIYTITCSSVVTTAIGKTYNVTGKLVDVGTVAASKSYTAGQKVVEPYPIQGV
jgi:hypothetical protein